MGNKSDAQVPGGTPVSQRPTQALEQRRHRTDTRVDLHSSVFARQGEEMMLLQLRTAM